jgi:hypothetical protein
MDSINSAPVSKKKYRGLEYEYFPEYSTILIEEYNAGNDAERILRTSVYAELLGFIKPNVVIIKNKGAAPLLSPFFKKFLRTYIYKDVLDYGVKHILFILSDEEFATAITDKEKPVYVTYCHNLEQALDAIRNNIFKN